ncbi:MAG TPA: DUF2807 domain-containing protein [Gammaproteobacteria bacterium]|nr:DUF2807 domain-containing protein [Gammaproteobacteria bacterium]
MRRTRLTVPTAVLLLSPLAALAQGADKTTDLKPFDTLEVGGCFDTKLTPGTPERVVVTATAEQYARMRVVQEGKTVKVGFKERSFDDYNICRDGKITVSITANFAKDQPVDLRFAGSGSADADVPRVAKLTAATSGSGGLTLRGAASDCRLAVAGSGSTDARSLTCDASTGVAVNGSGSTKLNGKTKVCEFMINGSGGVGADEFACDSADVSINGSGSVTLAKIADLKVEINGSGNVKYHGQPTLRGLSVHGSGKVQQL